MFNPEIVDLEQWGRLLQNQDFQAFVKYQEQRIQKLRNDMERTSRSPGIDSTYIQADCLARIDELKSLLNKVEFKKQQYMKTEAAH